MRTHVVITALKKVKTKPKKTKPKPSNHYPNRTPLTYDAFFLPIAVSLKAHMGSLLLSSFYTVITTAVCPAQSLRESALETFAFSRPHCVAEKSRSNTTPTALKRLDRGRKNKNKLDILRLNILTGLSCSKMDDFPGSYSKMLLGSARYLRVSTLVLGGPHWFLEQQTSKPQIKLTLCL